MFSYWKTLLIHGVHRDISGLWMASVNGHWITVRGYQWNTNLFSHPPEDQFLPPNYQLGWTCMTTSRIQWLILMFPVKMPHGSKPHFRYTYVNPENHRVLGGKKLTSNFQPTTHGRAELLVGECSWGFCLCVQPAPFPIRWHKTTIFMAL